MGALTCPPDNMPGWSHRWVESIGLESVSYGTRKTGNLRSVQPFLGHTKLESTVRYLGIEVDDALQIAEQIEPWSATPASHSQLRSLLPARSCVSSNADIRTKEIDSFCAQDDQRPSK